MKRNIRGTYILGSWEPHTIDLRKFLRKLYKEAILNFTTQINWVPIRDNKGKILTIKLPKGSNAHFSRKKRLLEDHSRQYKFG